MRLPRLPLLLYSYIAAELLAPFFASFIILYSVFFLVRLIPLLEVVLELRIGFADFVRLSSYIFPHMLLYVIPMASMTGVIIGFTRLTNDREILALKACGISLRKMLPPVILIAAAIAILTGFFSVRLIPAGEQGVKRLMFQLAKEKIDKGLKEKKFTEALGDLVVYVNDIDEQDNWEGVYVSDMRNRQQPIITVAKSGRMHAAVEKMVVTIVLNDGTLHSAEGADNQVVRFQRYQLEIPLRPPTRIDGDDVTQIGKGAMSQQQLLETAALYGPDSKKGRVYLSEYHHRLVLPVGCFILSLLGLPLGLQAGPGRRAAGIPLGLGFFVFYYVAFTTGRVLSEDMVLPLVFGMWLPNLLFALLTVYVFYRVDREKPLLSERVQRLIGKGYHGVFQPLLTRALKGLRSLLMQLPLGRRRERDPEPQAARHLHANPATLLYHLPQCEEYDCSLCTIEFISPEIADQAGFSPCPFCAQLLEKTDQ
ncbi:LptF/LptG family permease [Desulfogranum mediterraneum]|uniref:LptF/LptG family permease n=1 Tax=Desulfogranum mediterraneum TaxID=160661 RepID=UPI0003FFE930|nr:LptF/LptG family permease [Desulfogranum mediterraneum]